MGSTADYAGMEKDELIKNLTRDLTLEKNIVKRKDSEIECMFEQQSALVHLVKTLFDQLSRTRSTNDFMKEQWLADYDRLAKERDTNDWLTSNISANLAAEEIDEEAQKKAGDSDV